MQTKILITIFLIGFIGVLNAQENVDKNEMVGFACSFSGQPSKTVKKYTQKLNRKNYKWISKRLESKNNAERYMSVIILEKLNDIGKYKLNAIELNLISEIKKSDELVSVCSGCTYFDKVSLKELLTDDKILFAKNWLDYTIKMK